MIIIDSGVFIAAFSEKEEHHERAIALLEELKESGEALLITDVILGEVATLIARRFRPADALKFGKDLLDSKEIELIIPTVEETRKALELMNKFHIESFADGLSMAVMEHRNMKRIASFDSDFDRNLIIKRIN